MKNKDYATESVCGPWNLKYLLSCLYSQSLLTSGLGDWEPLEQWESEKWPRKLWRCDVTNEHEQHSQGINNDETKPLHGCSRTRQREDHSRMVRGQHGDKDTSNSPQITKHSTLPTNMKDCHFLLTVTLSHLQTSCLLVKNYQGDQYPFWWVNCAPILI